jgi:hypothetical protein
MAKRRNLTPESVVFVSTWGWRDCDPSGSVVATTERRAQELAEKGMRSDARNVADSGDGSIPYRQEYQKALDDIAWYGVHAETLSTLVTGLQTQWTIQELNENGYAYLDTP